MKRTINLLLIIISTVFVLTGCQNAPAEANRPWPKTVVMSNLNDETSRNVAERLLKMSSGEIQSKVFFDHVDQINRFLKPEELTNGFEEVSIAKPKYDPYDIQARWEAEFPEFLGYNCRITAWSLLRDLIQTEKGTAGKPDYIMMDLFSLDLDPSAIPDADGLEKFQTLYTGIDTENTKDISVHLKHLQEDWKKRHISFKEGDASLISVVLHDQVDGDKLFIGHTGILYEVGEKELYFLEKIAFQEPYQLVKVSSRSELSDYLMEKYDVEFNQPTASPFVLENDQLIEGYRNHSAP